MLLHMKFHVCLMIHDSSIFQIDNFCFLIGKSKLTNWSGVANIKRLTAHLTMNEFHEVCKSVVSTVSVAK